MIENKSLRILYDSAKTEYKSPFGCIKEGQGCAISIKVPKSCPAISVLLVIEKEGGQTTTVPLDSVCNEGEYRRFSGKFDLTPGLYFYYFRIVKEDSSFSLFRLEDHDTNMEDGEKWQLTCLPKDYTVPSRFAGKIMYQIFPDRFAKSGECDISQKMKPYVIHGDISEPPIKGPDENGYWNTDFYGGNLKGIKERLGYLKSFGVGVMYLNPIFTALSNHRYDTADYMKIDPMLGTEEDFSDLCAEAKKQGILIILDGVFSHVGSSSKYFQNAISDPNSPYRCWFDFRSYPDDYDCWWDVKTLPCVNELDNGFLDFIIRNEDSVVAHWLRLGASGFRLDVADELPDEFISCLRARVKKLDPDAIVIGEVWEDASNKISYDVRRKYFSAGELDGVMNYPFRDAIINLLCHRIGTEKFKSIIEKIYENYPFDALNCSMTFLSSHDTTRILTELGREIVDTVKALKAASAMQYFLPGMPSIYYGDEVGMTGGSDPFNRAFFMPTSNAPELIYHYRTLGELRSSSKALAFGSLEIFSNGSEIKIFRIFGDEKRILTVNTKSLEFNIE